MSEPKENENDNDYRDIPLDVPLRNAKEYRERKRQEDDLLRLCEQRSVFNKEYGEFLKSLEPMPDESKNDVPPAPFNPDERDFFNFLPWPNLNTNLNSHLNPNLNAGNWLEFWPPLRRLHGGLIPPMKKERVQLPADILEKNRASYISKFRLTAKSPLLQGWFATLTADLHWKILGYLTGVESVHTKALWISLRSDLTKFDTIPTTKSRSEVFFLERLSNNLFEQFDNRGKRTEKRRKLPISLHEFQIEYMKEVKKKRTSKQERIYDNNSVEEKSDLVTYDTSLSHDEKLNNDVDAECKELQVDKKAIMKTISMEEMDGSIRCIFVRDEFFSENKGILIGSRNGNAEEECGWERARVCGLSLDKSCSYCRYLDYARSIGNNNDALCGVLLKYRDKKTLTSNLVWFEEIKNSRRQALCRTVVKAETLGDNSIIKRAHFYHSSGIDALPRDFGHDWNRDDVWAKFSKIANVLKSPECKNVVVALGAGTTISRRIFNRSKERLYQRLMRVNLEAYKTNPRRILWILKMICAGGCRPSTAGRFLRELQKQGKLLRVYTQHIDGWEEKAGVDPDKVIQTHGNLKAAECINFECKAPYDVASFKKGLFDEFRSGVPQCEQCGNVVKPSIWMGGEPLLKGENLFSDLLKADLIIVAGAPMSIYPYNIIPLKARHDCPCLIINCEPSGTRSSFRDRNAIPLHRDVGLGSFVRLSQNRHGTVRWIGNIPEKAPGLWYGVELYGGGKNHGSFRGKQYFRCSQGRGVFVQLPQIKLDYSARLPCRLQSELNDTQIGKDSASIDTYYTMGDCDDGFSDLARLCGWNLQL